MRRRWGVLALAGVLLLVTACGGTEPDTVPLTVTWMPALSEDISDERELEIYDLVAALP